MNSGARKRMARYLVLGAVLAMAALTLYYAYTAAELGYRTVRYSIAQRTLLRECLSELRGYAAVAQQAAQEGIDAIFGEAEGE